MDAILRDFPSSFDTPRLTIRCPMPGDGAEHCAAVAESLDQLRLWLPWAVNPPTVEGSEATLRRAYARFLQRQEMWLLLFLKGTHTLVGGSGLHDPDWSVPSFEIGYWLRTSFAGQGYMTEAVNGIVDFAARELGAVRLQIVCDARNERSAAVARRCGFTHEGTLRCSARHHLTGELFDDLIFGKVIPR